MECHVKYTQNTQFMTLPYNPYLWTILGFFLFLLSFYCLQLPGANPKYDGLIELYLFFVIPLHFGRF